MKAIITGVLGQDGSYMAELLSSKQYEVYGLIRENAVPNWLKLLVPSITFIPINLLDKKSVYKVIDNVRPDEIYNFASVSDVLDPWKDLDLIFQTNALIPQFFLEVISKIDKRIKFFQASSCLIFGRDTSGFQNENTSASPIHPYGIAKLYADNMVKEFRATFGLYCCSGIFYNHNSPRMKEIFFSKKITSAVAKIKQNKISKISVGNLTSLRDYGWAPDFIKATYLMMHNSEPKDYVIGTGQLTSMEDFIKKCFDYVDLDYKKYVDQNIDIRSNDTNILRADINRIKDDLGWSHKCSVNKMISLMIDNALEDR